MIVKSLESHHQPVIGIDIGVKVQDPITLQLEVAKEAHQAIVILNLGQVTQLVVIQILHQQLAEMADMTEILYNTGGDFKSKTLGDIRPSKMDHCLEVLMMIIHQLFKEGLQGELTLWAFQLEQQQLAQEYLPQATRTDSVKNRKVSSLKPITNFEVRCHLRQQIWWCW